MAKAMEKPYPALQKHREGLWKWYHSRCDPNKPVGARTVCLADLLEALGKSEQLTAELDTSAVVEAWRQSLTYILPPDEIDETDTSIEVTLSQLTQIFLRCAIVKSSIKVDEVTWGGTSQVPCPLLSSCHTMPPLNLHVASLYSRRQCLTDISPNIMRHMQSSGEVMVERAADAFLRNFVRKHAV